MNQFDDINKDSYDLAKETDNEIPKEVPEEESLEVDKNIKKTKVISSRNILKLLKNPIFWIVFFIIFFIIIIALLVFQMDYDIYGVGIVRPDYMYTPCTTINYATQHYDFEKKEYYWSYTRYSLDYFITNTLVNIDKEAVRVNNSVIYEAMAIVLRNQILNYLNSQNTCTIYSTSNPFPFSNNTSDPSYGFIANAVTKSKGIVMVDKNTLNMIHPKYDIFTFYKKREEEETGSYYYHLTHKNLDREQVIPGEWVEELEEKKGVEIPKTKVKAQFQNESLSLYGAKYLLERIHSQYDVYQILEFYFGRDLKYYTVDPTCNSCPNGPGIYMDGCSQIAMDHTNLEKEEFISLVQEYGRSNPEALQLVKNADKIYDMAVSNNVNPELVFIRAAVEGHSPGSSYNNYWGLGCTNTGGLAACKNYKSLDEGVMAFLEFVSKYNTLTELMSHYAYLGSYWYNPGGSGVGGCYYAPYIFDEVPDYVKEACGSNHPCTTAGESTCVATTDEDKEAYLVYQSKTMIDARRKIFHLESENCESGGTIGEPGVGNCTIWRQGDSSWGNIKLGNSNTTMSASGCAVTSLAIAMSCSGTNINNVAAFNPGTLVNLLNSTGGFDGANLYWNANAIKQIAPNFSFEGAFNLNGNENEKASEVKNAATENSAVLLHFKNNAHPRGHWVVLKSVNGNIFNVLDPATGTENTYKASDVDSMRIYNF